MEIFINTIVITIVSFVAIYYLLKLIMYKKDESEPAVYYSSSSESETTPLNNESTPNIVFDALQSLGCQPEFGEHNILTVSYQGETFEFNFSENRSRFVRVWDPCWAAINANDPQFNLIKDAVNAANFNFGPTVLMTEPDENNMVVFHSRFDIIIHPECHDNDKYLKSILDSFFYAKEATRSNYHHLNTAQTELHKNRRPIGFSTPE